MAKAKSVSVAAPKQIVLTQEQYDILIEIYQTLDDATDQISELTNGEFNEMQLGYNLGMINSDLQMAYSQLDALTDEINPNKDWFNDEDEDNN